MNSKIDTNALQLELRRIRVCRFCLSKEQSKLTSIYMRDTRIKTSAPLPIQIMAIASMEVRLSNNNLLCKKLLKTFFKSVYFSQLLNFVSSHG